MSQLRYHDEFVMHKSFFVPILRAPGAREVIHFTEISEGGIYVGTAYCIDIV